MQGVYLIHFMPSYRHAAHYLGWSPEIQSRINAHISGKGARLTEVAYAAGIEMIWVRTWPDADRKVERKLKNHHGSGKFCPICNGEPVQMPLVPWMPAYMPQDEQEQPECNECNEQPQHTLSLFEIEAEAEEYEEDLLDREFWGRGSW